MNSGRQRIEKLVEDTICKEFGIRKYVLHDILDTFNEFTREMVTKVDFKGLDLSQSLRIMPSYYHYFLHRYMKLEKLKKGEELKGKLIQATWNSVDKMVKEKIAEKVKANKSANAKKGWALRKEKLDKLKNSK